MVLGRGGRYLVVDEDKRDSVDIIDTQSNKVAKSIKIAGPSELVPDRLQHYRGLSPNSLALSSDARTLYVTEGGINSIAVVDLFSEASAKGNLFSRASAKEESSSEGSAKGKSPALQPKVVGLIPTTFYPNSVAVSEDGQLLYLVNCKTPTGPNLGDFDP